MRPAPQELRRGWPDEWLAAGVLGLCGVGLVMVYSASSVVAFERFGDAAYFLKRQLAWFALGCTSMLVASRIPYTAWRTLALPLLGAAGVLMAAVLIPGIGSVAGGARRWIVVGPLRVQPVELAKFSLVLYLAHFLANRGERVGRFLEGLTPPLVVTAGFSALALQQPDMGSAVVLASITGAVLFAAGVRMLHLVGLAAVSVPVALWVALAEEYRRQRLLAFLDPWQDALGYGFHIIQSWIAIASGGVLGVGLGRSRQKFFYLPERHTDFIFAILAEELGMVGVAVVLTLYGVLIARTFRVALRAPDRYGGLLAAGVGSWVASQALLNMGVATGLLPVTGVPLPLVSFGGSSLVALMTAFGVCLNVSQYARSVPPGSPARRRRR